MSIMNRKITWITASLVIIYWLSESLMDTPPMRHLSFTQRLLDVDAAELWIRIIVMALVVAFGAYTQQMLTKVHRYDQRLMRMNDCFLDFGPDPVANINRLTSLCGELLNPAAAFYHRVDQETVHSWGQWCPGGELPPEATPRGVICSGLIREGVSEGVTLIRNLPQSVLASGETCIDTCGWHTYMGKTVSLGGEVVGSLCLLYGEDFSPSDDDKRLMGIIASAIGVEEIRRRAQIALRESEDRLHHLSAQLFHAQEEERKRLALQLHDSVGQSLSALKFGIEETLETLAGEVDRRKIRALEISVPLIREIVAEIRRIQRELYPATLDDLGIIPTIKSFAKQFGTIYRNIVLETTLRVNEAQVPRDLKPVIYRILQEAMNNVAKHSRADHASIRLTREEDNLVLAIEDNGQGFDSKMPAADRFKKGLGLSSMRERAELSGGSFRLDSEKGSGTRIVASWSAGEAPLTLR